MSFLIENDEFGDQPNVEFKNIPIHVTGKMGVNDLRFPEMQLDSQFDQDYQNIIHKKPVTLTNKSKKLKYGPSSVFNHLIKSSQFKAKEISSSVLKKHNMSTNIPFKFQPDSKTSLAPTVARFKARNQSIHSKNFDLIQNVYKTGLHQLEQEIDNKTKIGLSESISPSRILKRYKNSKISLKKKKLSLQGGDISIDYGIGPITRRAAPHNSRRTKADSKMSITGTLDSSKNLNSKSFTLRTNTKSVLEDNKAKLTKMMEFKDNAFLRKSVRKAAKSSIKYKLSSKSPYHRNNLRDLNPSLKSFSDRNSSKSNERPSPKYLNQILQRNYLKEMEKKVHEHGERLKKIPKTCKKFYWMPDLSIAGFATQSEIKKNFGIWNSKNGIKLEKERVIDWKNPQNINKPHREDQDYQIWKN
ncbi:unnamed protein product [Moneuplotes crassus]|uniref:Uncharacterized protein n=2 Tax=Euplotes crassus TaxID=5936 RepID=A0AAD1U5U9_EUPCR|nr:unnamed protein product [Moneuplotes crassus]